MSSEPHYGSSSRHHHQQPHQQQQQQQQQQQAQQAQQAQNDYSIPSNHRSYETVTTASGSGSSAEPAGYQTDPTSSDNSSIERMQSSVPKRQPEPVNDYGIGFGQSPSYQPPSFSLGVPNSGMNGGVGGGGYSNGNNYQVSGAPNYGNAPPPVPQKEGGILRKPISNNPVHQARPAQPEKRKSWFSRRFSKHG